MAKWKRLKCFLPQCFVLSVCCAHLVKTGDYWLHRIHSSSIVMSRLYGSTAHWLCVCIFFTINGIHKMQVCFFSDLLGCLQMANWWSGKAAEGKWIQESDLSHRIRIRNDFVISVHASHSKTLEISSCCYFNKKIYWYPNTFDGVWRLTKTEEPIFDLIWINLYALLGISITHDGNEIIFRGNKEK